MFINKKQRKEKRRRFRRRRKELAFKIIEERKSAKEQNEKDQKETYEGFFKESFRTIIESEKNEENKEIVQVRSLASLGLIVSSFSHELKEVCNNASEIDTLEKNVFSLIPKEKYSTVEYEDTIDIFELLKEDKEKLALGGLHSYCNKKRQKN